jgi:IS1 family transposase
MSERCRKCAAYFVETRRKTAEEKAIRPNIAHIYTDANSCYARAFKLLGVPEPHTMTKAETHLIESSDSRFRDRLARFNRRTRRFSKSLPMLRLVIDLFLARGRRAV